MFACNKMYFARVLSMLVVISHSISSASVKASEDFLTTISKKNAEVELEDSSTLVPELEMCDVTNPCENGGKCVQKVCSCLKGTSGPMCKTIDDCGGGSKCGEVDCLFNVTSLEAYCKCSNTSLAFDDATKKCQECDCGAYQRSCSFVSGNKKCHCMENYQQKFYRCAYCDCGAYGNCSFHRRIVKTCQCLDGYANKNGTCTECMCGNDTGCAFDGDNKKNCFCKDGYQLKDGVCTECDCGNGLCSFNEWGEKKCVCNSRYEMFNGTCQKCECEDNERCFFAVGSGEKVCICLDGYATKNGTCTECNCGSYAQCDYHRDEKSCYCNLRSLLVDGICRDCDCGPAATLCTVTREGKICTCFEGFADQLGTCERCDCGFHAKSCTFKEGKQNCTCMEGYADLNGLCTDCDCGLNGTCSLSDATVSIFRDLGVKTCYCDQGYVEYEGRCKAICEEGQCNNGVCIVTGSNFSCTCNQGFTGLRCDERIKNISDVLSVPIIVFTILCIAIVGFFIGTLCLVRRNRNLKKINTQNICLQPTSTNG